MKINRYLQYLADLLRAKQLTVSTAESCTGGNIAHEITEIAGSSDYFMGSVVSYSNNVKQSVLGVSSEALENEGAVSRTVVEQMCNGRCQIDGHAVLYFHFRHCRSRRREAQKKPVGTVWICAKCGDKTVSERYHFPGTRDRVIDRASMTGLLMLIKLLRDQ